MCFWLVCEFVLSSNCCLGVGLGSVVFVRGIVVIIMVLFSEVIMVVVLVVVVLRFVFVVVIMVIGGIIMSGVVGIVISVWFGMMGFNDDVFVVYSVGVGSGSSIVIGWGFEFDEGVVLYSWVSLVYWCLFKKILFILVWLMLKYMILLKVFRVVLRLVFFILLVINLI